MHWPVNGKAMLANLDTAVERYKQGYFQPLRTLGIGEIDPKNGELRTKYSLARQLIFPQAPAIAREMFLACSQLPS